MTLRRRCLPLALAALALAACARPPRAQDAYARAVAEAVPLVEKGTGLTFKRAPAYQVRTREQMHDFLQKVFAQEKSQRDIAEQQTVLRRLGAIPDTLDLHQLMLDVYTEQVAGLYDPKSKTLFLVEGTDPAVLDFTVQHELVHALQDQYMNLDSLENLKGDDDRSLAAAAVIEGQATLVPLQAVLGPGANFPGGWDRVRDAIRDNASSMPVMARTPEFLQEMMIFPYVSGAEFVHRFQVRMPGKMPYGADLPTSTAQVIHGGAFFDTPRQQPVEIALPAPRGAVLEYDNVMGEFATKVLLYELLKDANGAALAADGWVGDRYAVLKAPQGTGVAWLTVLRSAVDAGEFAQAMESLAAARYPGARGVKHGTATTFTVNGRVVTVWGGEVNGRAAVLYLDLPAGERADPFDLAKVRLN
ncbi:MAG TPA: hypothetical protein VMT93_02095 [Gemmatimonadaceae bacterium]|nr:hypothetical protein [Gemmatimonadaceae bacterium]